ncbi:histidine phosphatase superfamily [Echria macrotheca]|uniref:Histidine phosphatase superfamily n=1 Tax=Echria macrotheca TaxID=438768 RepID=A0AAJ0BNS0_9PEZI|nr:histidine phosphatase superfamily [Echria macrotheca]
MAPLAAWGLVLLAATGRAQTLSEHVWSSVVWVLNGERTPLWGSLPEPVLTPAGAQQMFSQGALIRNRYLRENETELNTEFKPIVDIEGNAIDNSQLSILTNTDQFMVNSAQAFAQGLYPPILQAFAENNGGMDAARTPNGSIVNYPLGGYQYANMRTASVLDFESVWIGGHIGCTAYTESLLTFRADDIVETVYNNTLNFYQTLWAEVLHEVFPPSMANFGNAYLLYDYASFRYNHDNATRANVSEGEMAMMARFASTEQRNKNANLSVSGYNQGDMIRAVAGRTMASKTLSWFRENMRMAGATNKLNLAFTTLEPFVAFFALSGLIIGDHAADFKPLPEPGAMMVFEMFSISENATVYPDPEDLWVRFLYRNGTDENDILTPYPLFNGSEIKIPLATFLNGIQQFGVSTISQWCNLCDSISLFCQDLQGGYGGSGGSSSGSGSGGPSPVLAGVIGAAVTLLVAGILFLAAVAFGVVSFRRADDAKTRSATLGGFKGAEKMASDTDLAFAKSGARHERTGSWELRGGKGQEEGVKPTPAGVTVQSRDLTHPKNDDDDAISVYGQAPVKPREF